MHIWWNNLEKSPNSNRYEFEVWSNLRYEVRQQAKTFSRKVKHISFLQFETYSWNCLLSDFTLMKSLG